MKPSETSDLWLIPLRVSYLCLSAALSGLIRGQFKVVRGNLSQSGWTGLLYPNSSGAYNPSKDYQYCGTTVDDGCMYDIYQDPTERTNIAAYFPELFQQMQDRMDEVQQTVFNPQRGLVDTAWK